MCLTSLRLVPGRRVGSRVVSALTLTPSMAWAHETGPLRPHDLWGAWTFDPLVIAGLASAAWLYARGLGRLRTRPRAERGIPRWRVRCFTAGVIAAAVALVSPLAAVGGVLFSAHMLQHVVLMLIAAPLLVLGVPWHVMPWSLAPAPRRKLRRGLRRPAVRGPWHALMHPASCWILHTLAVWIWHAPALFQLTIESEAAHALQHVSFFGTALLFWGALGETGHSQRMSAGAGVIYVFTTALHGTILGALLTLAPAPLYPAYGATTPAWGLTPLEDQQVGGLIMWVPAGLVYVAAGLALLGVWLHAADRRVRRIEAARVGPAPRGHLGSESNQPTIGVGVGFDSRPHSAISRDAPPWP